MPTQSDSPFSHTADYAYLEYALQSRWDTYEQLTDEMRVFVPRPVEDFEDEN